MSHQKYPQASVSTTSATGTPRKGRASSYSQVKAHARQDRKRHEAYARQDKYDLLTTKQKIIQLGPTGSERQRNRLELQLLEEQASNTPNVPVVKTEKKSKSKKVEIPRVAIP